ncbi:MAG: hypothetical protein ACLT3W_06270 [Bifidobacterium pseudocatenulatum]
MRWLNPSHHSEGGLVLELLAGSGTIGANTMITYRPAAVISIPDYILL